MTLDHALLWFDLETTGLDENSDSILEVGWGITDLDLQWIDRPRSILVGYDATWINERVDPFVIEMHEASGLWNALEKEPTWRIQDIESLIVNALEKHVSPGKVTMAGSGVGQFDMRWVAKWMPRLHSRLTYYTIDMGTYERVLGVLAGTGIRPSRNEAAHRAVADVLWAHGEALRYREQLMTDNQPEMES